MEINFLLILLGIIFFPGLTFAVIPYLLEHPFLAILALFCAQSRVKTVKKTIIKTPYCNKPNGK